MTTTEQQYHAVLLASYVAIGLPPRLDTAVFELQNRNGVANALEPKLHAGFGLG